MIIYTRCQNDIKFIIASGYKVDAILMAVSTLYPAEKP